MLALKRLGEGDTWHCEDDWASVIRGRFRRQLYYNDGKDTCDDSGNGSCDESEDFNNTDGSCNELNKRSIVTSGMTLLNDSNDVC